MELIDREGVFRFEIVEHGVSTGKNGFPAFVARLSAKEFYDDSGQYTDDGEPGWIDWSEYDQYITAYLVLFNNDKAIFHYEDLQAAIGWDGSSFADLADEQHVGKTIIAGIEENEYNGQVRLQVKWVDAPDADPERGSGGIKTLDSNELSGLDAKFAGMMASNKPKPAAKPAKAAAKKANPPKPKASAPPTPKQSKGMTKEKAWEQVCSLIDTCGETEVTNAWLEAVETRINDTSRDEESFTNADWEKVCTNANNILGQAFV